MKLEIRGTFKDKEEFENKREEVRKLLEVLGFDEVRTHEDLITSEWVFWCRTKGDLP